MVVETLSDHQNPVKRAKGAELNESKDQKLSEQGPVRGTLLVHTLATFRA